MALTLGPPTWATGSWATDAWADDTWETDAVAASPFLRSDRTLRLNKKKKTRRIPQYHKRDIFT
jgi:hypothetical protein